MCECRTSDYDAYLNAILFPAATRPQQWALRAFNVETAGIREHVSDTTLGRMRIQWWRDAIDQTFKVSADQSRDSLAGHTARTSRRTGTGVYARYDAGNEQNVVSTHTDGAGNSVVQPAI
jgi:NADH dehydrogenase [ubiquinone] 1 alpha subcomplex assembly factor 6